MAAHRYPISGVGEILFEKSRKARRINISIRPFKGVRVAVPTKVSYRTARTFAESKAEWIQKHLKKMAETEASHRSLAETYAGIDRKKARKRLVERLNDLARRHEFSYNRVFVRNQKTRWGSCSPANNISLNIKLVRLPAELMDYIIIHELVHTQIKNHGRQFYRELERIVGPRRELDRQLKRYEPGLG